MRNKNSIGIIILLLVSLFAIGCIGIDEKTATMTATPNKTEAINITGDNRNSILQDDNVTDITDDARNNFSIILQHINKNWISDTAVPTPTLGFEYIVIDKKSSGFEFTIIIIVFSAIYILRKRR